MHTLSPKPAPTSLAGLLLSSVLCGPIVGITQAESPMPKISESTLAAYLPAVYQSPSGETLPYRVMPPSKIERKTKYPLVVFLHGAGERGDDNEIQLVHAASEFARADRRERFPAFVVFPQCPKEKRWVESPWDLPSGKGEFEDEPSEPMQLVLELVDTLVKHHPIDTNRLYVAGLSMGAQGAWFAVVAPPRRFAALVEVCGGGDPTWAKRYAGIPIWAFHGQEDNVVPISRGREMIKALTDAGHHPELRYVEYPEVKHNSWTQTYARDDVYEWLFSKRKSSNSQ